MNWFLSWTLLVNIWLIDWLTTNQPLWWFLIIIVCLSLFLGKKIFIHLKWYKLGLAIICSGIILTHGLMQNHSNSSPLNLQSQKQTVLVKEKYTNFYIVSTKEKDNYYLSKFYYQNGKKQVITMEVHDKVQLCYKNKTVNNPQQKQWLWKNFQIKNQIYIQSKNCSPKINKSNTLYNKSKIFLLQNNSKTNQKWINFLLFQQTAPQFQKTKSTMSQMGIIHLFVISGFHLIIFIKIWFQIAKKIKIKPIKMSLEVVGLLSALFLVYLTNWKFSASKAFILILLNWLSKKLQITKSDPRELIALITLFFLMLNPLLFYQIGFQLSCLARWSLVSNCNNAKATWKQKIKQIMQKNWIVLMVLLPILINLQHQLSLFTNFYSLFYGLLTIFLYPVFFLTIWWKFTWFIWETVFNWFEQTLTFIKTWDLVVPFGWWNEIVITFYYCLGIIFYFGLKKSQWKTLLVILWISNLIIFTVANWNQEYYQIHFINVGHGLAILIQGPNKKTNILLDAGIGKEQINNSNKINKYLKRLAVNRLDAVFISHNHTDHYNNLAFLSQEMIINQVITNQNQQTKYQINELVFENFAYSYYWKMKKENNRGLVLYTKINDYKILFTFDLEQQGEIVIMKKQKLKPVDILQVGHHGAGNASTMPFLQLLKPKHCLISSNQTKPSAIKNLKKVKCQILNTKNKNNITLTLGKPIQISWN